MADDEEHEPAYRRPLTGWKKRSLIRELAAGDQTQAALAEKYEVTEPAISAFKKRNADLIAAQVADMENELAALWIAKKANRLAEYEAQAEMVREAIRITGDMQLVRLLQPALRNAAEEMGHLKGTVEVDHKVTHYTVEGIDPKDLT